MEKAMHVGPVISHKLFELNKRLISGERDSSASTFSARAEASISPSWLSS